MEKGTDFYLHSHLFMAKMGLLVTILILELSPMIGLIRWRAALGKGGAVDTSRAAWYAKTSRIQAVRVLLMVLAATGMARGYDF